VTHEAPSRRVSDAVVHHLAALLVEAKRGNVEAVAFVAVGPNGKPIVKFAGEGDLVPSVNLGLDILKATFMAQIVSTGAEMNSGLVVPGRGN
jgi:hypothetical protein